MWVDTTTVFMAYLVLLQAFADPKKSGEDSLPSPLFLLGLLVD